MRRADKVFELKPSVDALLITSEKKQILLHGICEHARLSDCFERQELFYHGQPLYRDG